MREKTIRFIQYGKYIKERYDSCHIAAYSASAAFFVLLSAVPLIMSGIILVSTFVPLDIIDLQQRLTELFAESISVQLSDYAAEIVEHSTVPLASVTMVFLLWAATRGIRSIGDGIDVIYDGEDDYNFIQRTLRSVVYAFVIVAVAVLSLAVLVFTSPMEKFVSGILVERAAILLTLLNMRNIIFFFALTLLFATAYKGLVKSQISFKNQICGAAFAAAGWILYSFGYSIYIRYFSRYSALYGSFGAVMLFMLWMYMCMNILLCGALVNKLVADAAEKKADMEYKNKER